MIVAFVNDPYLRDAVVRAARREEDVVFDPVLASHAANVGYPRLIVTDAQAGPMVGLRPEIPVLELTRSLLARWEAERRGAGELSRWDHLTRRMRKAIDAEAAKSSWVDDALGDLSRAAEAPPPPPLRAFGRRVLEFPWYYTDLHALAEQCQLSRGALKARFRRRGLTSPYTYLRWFRMMACAHVLSDRDVTVAVAAHRLGFTSDGNLCRTMVSLTGYRPTELRSGQGWERLVSDFAGTYLASEDMAAWLELGDLFEPKVA